MNSDHYHVSQSDYFSVQTSVETLRREKKKTTGFCCYKVQLHNYIEPTMCHHLERPFALLLACDNG